MAPLHRSGLKSLAPTPATIKDNEKSLRSNLKSLDKLRNGIYDTT